MNRIGELIKATRKRVGLTQEQLANKSKLSKTAIWNYENGKRIPSLDVINAISVALDVPSSTFIEVQNDFTKTIEEIAQGIIENNNFTSRGGEEFLPLFKKTFPDMDISKYQNDSLALQQGIYNVLVEYFELSAKVFTSDAMNEYMPGQWPDSLEEYDKKAEMFGSFIERYKHDADEARALLDRMAKFIFEINWKIEQIAEESK